MRFAESLARQLHRVGREARPRLEGEDHPRLGHALGPRDDPRLLVHRQTEPVPAVVRVLMQQGLASPEHAAFVARLQQVAAGKP